MPIASSTLGRGIDRPFGHPNVTMVTRIVDSATVVIAPGAARR
jgi:hypothetical protein